MKSIINKIKLFSFITTLMVVLIFFVNFYLNSSEKENAKIVNIAGKQRMLSQKSINEVNRLVLGKVKETNSLNRVLSDFSNNLIFLNQAIATTKNQSLKEKLDEISTKWRKYKEDIEGLKKKLLEAEKEKVVKEDLIESILSVSDSVVQLLVKYDFSQEIIDIAGRQRMLTQKMAYHNLKYLMFNEEQDYKKFQEAFKLYDETIFSFLKNERMKSIENLYNVVEINYNFWQDYSRMDQIVIENNKELNVLLEDLELKTAELLNLSDILVSAYQEYFERHKATFSSIQYILGFIFFLAFVLVSNVTKEIDNNFKNFLEKTKNLANFSQNPSEDFTIEKVGERELDEASANINSYIEKVNIVINSSTNAIEQSQKAIEELDELIESLADKDDSKLSKSEDMAIQSSEELLQAVQILKKLKKNLKDYTQEQ